MNLTSPTQEESGSNPGSDTPEIVREGARPGSDSKAKRRIVLPASSLRPSTRRPAGRKGFRIGGILLLGACAAAGWIGYRAWLRAQPPAVDPDQERAAVWKAAEDDAESHPDDFDRSIAVFEKAGRRLAGSDYEIRARQAIERLQGLRDAAEAAAFADLESRVQALADAGEWEKAEEVLNRYDGPFAARLSGRRDEAAARLRDRATEAKEQQALARKEAAARSEAALAAAAAALYSGDLDRAGAILRGAMEDRAAPADRTVLERPALWIDQMLRADPAILAGFEAQKGTEIEMIDVGQTIRVRVVDVRADRILLERQRGAGWAAVEMTPAQLPVDERKARLTQAFGPEVGALWAGLGFLRANRPALAAHALADAGEFAPLLLARIDAAQGEAEEARAREAQSAPPPDMALAPAPEPAVAAPVEPSVPVPPAPPGKPLRPLIDDDFERTSRPVAVALARNPRLKIVRDEGVGGGRAVLAEYVGYDQGSERIGVTIPLGRGVLEATLCFDVRFAEGFQFVQGGKLNGLGPAAPITGGNPMRPEGWSARMMWGRGGTLQTYLYCQNKEGQYGQSESSRSFRFTPGRYHSVTLHVKLNDPPDQANGFAHVYVDGTLEARHEGVQFRADDGRKTLIQNFMFSSFHGGHTPEWAPKTPDGKYSTETAWFDNLAVYPGPYVRPAPPPTP